MKTDLPQWTLLMLAWSVVLATGFFPRTASAEVSADRARVIYAQQFNGKLLNARGLLIDELKKASDVDDRIILLDHILRSCIRASDDACVRKYTPEIVEDAASAAERVSGYDKVRYHHLAAYYLAHHALLFEDLAAHRDLIFGKWIDTSVERIPNGEWSDDDLYMRRQFLCARMYAELGEAARAQVCADKAMSLLASLRTPRDALYALTGGILEAFSVLAELGDTERAYGVYLSTRPLGELIPPNSIEHLLYRLAEADLLEKTGDVAGAKAALDKASNVEQRLELSAESRDYLRSQIHLPRSALCVLLADMPCAKASLEQTPFHKEFERTGRAPANGIELAYVAARGFAGAAAGHGYDPRILRALGPGLSFEVPGVPNEQLAAYRTLALALSQKDPSRSPALLIEAMGYLISAIRSRASATRSNWYRPGAIDRIFLMLALYAQQEEAPVTTEALFVGLQMINRNRASFQMDALSLLVAAKDEATHRGYRQSLRSKSGRDRWERFIFAELTAAAAGPPTGAAPLFDKRIRDALDAKSAEVLQAGSLLPPTDPARLVGLREFQSVLRGNEAALYLAPTFGSQLAYMCVRRDNVRYFLRKVPFDQLDRDQRLLQAALTAIHAPSASLDKQFPVQSAVRLYDQLIRPFEECLRAGDQIDWLPGAYALNIPLGVLLKQAPPAVAGGYDLAKAQWLILDHSISYPGSASLLLATRTRSFADTKSAATFLGVGDPVLTASPAAVSSSGDGSPQTSVSRLKPLPDTRTELEASAAAFPKSQLLLGAEATEASLRRRLTRQVRYLSFATHAVIRDDGPDITSPALVLTRGSGEPEDDGLLTTDEIGDLDLHATFVALSACNTANYDLNSFADEVPALGLAFSLAGVPVTLATLWPVDSATSNQVVSATFASLARGGTPAAAMAAAQRSYLARNEDIARFHPRFWSPFILLGDGSAPAR